MRKALRNNDSVKYAIGEFAAIEARIAVEEEKEKLAALIRDNFARYEDPAGLFSLVVPKKWRAQRDQYWNGDRSVLYHTTVLAPENAGLAQVRGYVSEGLRIQLQLPRKGSVFTSQGIARWKNSVAQDLLKANPGFALTDSGTMEFGGMAATVYHFVGQDRRLPEPEKTVMIVTASPEALITVEVIAPTSKLKLLDAMRVISATTFKWAAR
ncbi:MAG TPA: hypothetical protein VIM99_15600 [Blastocatellia bacterium]